MVESGSDSILKGILGLVKHHKRNIENRSALRTCVAYHVTGVLLLWTYKSDRTIICLHALPHKHVTFHESVLSPRYPPNILCPQAHFTGLHMGAKAETDCKKTTQSALSRMDTI